MNPLTLVKRIQTINSKEAALGISDDASWHAKYKESAYVFVGGIPFDLTEGDLLAVFSQYGEIVDVNLVRDKGTGKSKGFAFVAYEDQRSTTLAVDNLNGAQILGRIIRVDHVSNYKKKEEEDEEKEQQKREARGVCYAFQKGECNRGASCKFSHDEQRNANTGWGPKDSSWEHDKYEVPSKSHKRSSNISSDLIPQSRVQEGASRFRTDDKDAKTSREEGDERDTRGHRKRSEADPRDQDRRGLEKRSERNEKEPNYKEDRDRKAIGKRSAMQESELNSRDRDRRGREEKKSGRHESEPNPKEDRDERGHDRRSRYDSGSSIRHYKKEDEQLHKKSHR